MDTIRAVLVEDETHTRNVLRKMLHNFCEGVEVVGEAANIEEAVKVINTQNPELVFLDIEMPKANGFELFKHFENPTFEVIFATAYSQYAIKAIRMAALDYLVKPIDFQDLQESLERYKSKRSNFPNLKDQYAIVQNSLQQPLDKIILPDQNGYQIVKLEDIIRLQAENSYTMFILKNAPKILVSKGLGEYEEILPNKNFIRVHRSHLVNMDYITRLQRTRQLSLIMEDGYTVNVSQNKKQPFLQSFLGS
ncbi:MAG: response regulator transcription factor [Aureispira sp.]|nr:response regulator transcription factor [Aureispira sp.]